jgi:hypothetical protein
LGFDSVLACRYAQWVVYNPAQIKAAIDDCTASGSVMTDLLNSMDEHEAHTADGMTNCPAFQKLEDDDCGPPVLHNMFRQAGLLDDATTERGSQESSAPKEEK